MTKGEREALAGRLPNAEENLHRRVDWVVKLAEHPGDQLKAGHGISITGDVIALSNPNQVGKQKAMGTLDFAVFVDGVVKFARVPLISLTDNGPFA